MLARTATDEQLWVAIKAGKIPAFEALVRRYWEAVYTTAFSYLKDPGTAMDITNDTFLSIWQKKDSLNIQSFKNYLTTCARYHVYKVLKAQQAQKLVYVEDYDALAANYAVENQAEEKMRYRNLLSDIEHAMRDLPKRCREIFILSRLEGFSNSEIADKFSISKRTVENQISFAQKYLRENSEHIALIIALVVVFS